MSRNPSSGKTMTLLSLFNTGGAFLVYGVTLVANLFANKYLVGILGPVAFGAWQVCFRLLTNINLGAGPAAQALRWVVANKRDSVDGKQLRRYVGSAFLLWGGVTLVTLVVGTGLALLAPRLVKDLPEAMSGAVQLTCLILMIQLVVLSGGRVFLAALQGMNLMYKATLENSGIEVLRAALLVTAAGLGWGIAGMAGATVVVSMVAVGLFWRLASRNVAWFGIARPRRQDFRAFGSFGGWMLFWNLVSQILFASDLIILGWVAGPGAVTVLTFSQYVPMFGVYVLALVASAITPGFGQLVGGGELARAAAVREELHGLAWLFVVVLGAGILLWNESFVILWVGEENYGGSSVNLLLVVVLLQAAFIRIDGLLIDVFLDVKAKVLWAAVATLAALLLAWQLGMRHGIVGVLGGMAAGRAILTVAYPVLIRRFLDIGVPGFPDLGWRRLVVSLALLASAFYGGPYLRESSLWQFLAGGVFSGLVLAFLAFFLGLDRDLRGRIKLRGKVFLKRRNSTG